MEKFSQMIEAATFQRSKMVYTTDSTQWGDGKKLELQYLSKDMYFMLNSLSFSYIKALSHHHIPVACSTIVCIQSVLDYLGTLKINILFLDLSWGWANWILNC